MTAPRSSDTLAGLARNGYDRAIDVLERLVPVARGLQRYLRGYAALVGAAGAVTALVLLADDVPGTWYTWAAWLVAVAILAAAPVVLLVFATMLNELLALPAKLRALPDVSPLRARELGALVREAHARGATVHLRTLPRDLWRLGRLVGSYYGEVPSKAALMALVRVPVLIAVGVAVVFGLVEIALAPTLVLFVVASRILP